MIKRKLKFGLFISFWACFQSLCGQSFTGVGGEIKDDGSVNNFTLKVSGLPNVIDSTFGLEQVCLNIVHTYDKDLYIYVVSPDGIVCDLSRRNGDEYDDYVNTCFSNATNASINNGAAPFTGLFKPETSLGGINNGSNPNGVWRLVVVDTYPEEESGKVVNWKLTFSKKPAKAFPFRQSRLPIVVIQTRGNVIVDEPKVKVKMGIIDNGPGKVNAITDEWNGYNGEVKMELRGKSSQKHPKLSFAIQTLDSAGEKKAAKILDMHKDEDWVLTAGYSDKSLLRNFLAYYLYRQMGNYSPRMRFVEVVMDGDYRGVYLLGEKIKREKDRVDVSKLDSADNAGDSLTGGYIIKLDWKEGTHVSGWESQYTPLMSTEKQKFLFHYPTGDKMTGQQKEYIKSYVDSFEVACENGWTDTVKGYRHFIDVQSFIDFIFLAELGKNVDAYWVSTYFYKDKKSKGGKLFAGPVWDYDLAFGNFEAYYGYAPNGWHWQEYGTTSDNIPRFWATLFKEPGFQAEMKCRWLELRKTVFRTDRILAVIDSAAKEIDEEQKMNFLVWPIWGVYTWPIPKPYRPDYPSEIQSLKDWFITRLAWMDAMMPGECK